MKYIQIIALAALWCALTTYATVIVEIRLDKFDSRGRNAKGKDCDPRSWGNPDKKCDPKFKFCIDEYYGNTSPDSCRYLDKKSDYYKNDNAVDFGGSIKGVDNPLRTSIRSYSGIRFKVDVDDRDSNSNDNIDKFDLRFRGSPGPRESVAPWQSMTLTGKRNKKPSKLEIRIKAYCADNYYGTSCSVYCVRADNDRDGHYTCDRSTGAKICLEGWEGEDCRRWWDDCLGTPCANEGTCTDGDNSFTCECAPGFTGYSCAVPDDYCESYPCLGEGYGPSTSLWWGLCGESLYSDAGVFTPSLTRIMRGTEARENEFPWMVLLQNLNDDNEWKGFCGGSIIHPSFVLTAAHCVDEGLDVDEFRLVVGEHNTSGIEGREAVHHVDEIFLHSGWDTSVAVNDIAILRLKDPITFTNYVQPVCEPSDSLYVGETVQLSGWGYADVFYSIFRYIYVPSVLNWVEQEVISNSDCEDEWESVANRPLELIEGQICAHYADERQRSVCSGDSGGPMTRKSSDNIFQQIGITSYGIPSQRYCNTGGPQVFTRVSEYKDWISETIAANLDANYYG